MVVVIDNGATVKKFGVTVSALGYAETMMRKGHDVWVVSTRTARMCEFI